MNRNLFRIAVLLGFCFTTAYLNLSAQGTTAQQPKLADGRYEMRATYKFSDQKTTVNDVGGGVRVSVKGDELQIVLPISPTPVIARLSGNKFKGQLENAGVSIEFQGEIVENNHVEGVFTGRFAKRLVNGLWTLDNFRKEEKKGV